MSMYLSVMTVAPPKSLWREIPLATEPSATNLFSVWCRAGVVLLSGGEEKYVAPGLKLPVVLQYSPKGDDEACHHRGSLEVFVNSSLSLTIPISALVHLMLHYSMLYISHSEIFMSLSA